MESFQIILNHREQNTYNFGGVAPSQTFLKASYFLRLIDPRLPQSYLNKTEQFPKHFVMFLSIYQEQSGRPPSPAATPRASLDHHASPWALLGLRTRAAGCFQGCSGCSSLSPLSSSFLTFSPLFHELASPPGKHLTLNDPEPHLGAFWLQSWLQQQGLQTSFL